MADRMSGALRLIIETHPAWQEGTASDRSVPAPRQTLYTLLGRRGTLWHTIVPRIATLDDALQTLDRANRSQLFDRLVIAEAHGLAGQPLGNWETCVCAVPHAVLAAGMMLHHGASFADLLGRAASRDDVRLRPEPHGTVTAIRADRRDATLWLLILLGVGLWSQTPAILCGVALLCSGEALYQEGALDRLSRDTRLLQTGRFYFYSLCAGLVALPLLAGTMLWLLDRLGF